MTPAPLRIAHLTTVDLSLWALLATELRVDVEAGLEVHAISAPGPYVADVEALGVNHVPVPSFSRAWSPRSDLRAARELWGALGRLDLDVLHTHTPKAGVLGRVLGRMRGVPVVVHTTHGVWAQPDHGLARRTLVHAAEGLAAQFSDAELYQNDADRIALSWAVRARKARTVGNGIDLERFRPDDAGAQAVRAGLGLGPDDLLVGGVGRLVDEKGIREFAAAARSLAGRATFVWVGPEDPDKPDAVRDAAGVTLLGMRADMPAVYTAFDVFVLPSYREGFSRSSMEAAACGTAMVLSDIPGCRVLGTDGEHMVLVPPRDERALARTIGDLLEDPTRRRRLGQAARHRARTAFDQRRVAEASLSTYAEVASRKGVAAIRT